MRHRMLFLILTALLSSVLSPFTTEGAALGQQTATPDESQQKRQYENNMEERLRKLGKQLDELKTKAVVMTEQAQKDIDQYLVKAEKKGKVASQKLEKMRKESVTKWKKISAELEQDAADFEKAYEKAKARFKEQQ